MSDALKDLLDRLERTLNDPDNRALWLHWSDAGTLRDAIARLERDERREKALWEAVQEFLSDAGNGL